MSEASSKNPSPEEIASKLNQLLDDERTGQYFYWIPISACVKLCMSHPAYSLSTVVALCRQVLKRFLDGESRATVDAYLQNTIKLDDRYSRMVIVQTLDCASVAAKIMKGEVSREQGVKELLVHKNADQEVVTAMLDMVEETIKQSNGKYTAEKLSGLLDAASPLAGYYSFISLGSIVLWPVLTYVAGFRWWVALLCAVGAYLFCLVVMAFIDVQLEKK